MKLRAEMTMPKKGETLDWQVQYRTDGGHASDGQQSMRSYYAAADVFKNAVRGRRVRGSGCHVFLVYKPSSTLVASWHGPMTEELHTINPEGAPLPPCEDSFADSFASWGDVLRDLREDLRQPEKDNDDEKLPPVPVRHDIHGAPLVPGYNLDRIDLRAGLHKAAMWGYGSPKYQMIVQYALMRHARGEEDGAEKSALSGGVDLTSWKAILAEAITSADRKAAEAELTKARLLDDDKMQDGRISVDTKFYNRMTKSSRDRHVQQILALTRSIRDHCDQIERDLNRQEIPEMNRTPILGGFTDAAIKVGEHVMALDAIREIDGVHEACLAELPAGPAQEQ